jgi:hypothetical protein
MASSICVPMIVTPVRNATPAHAPTTITVISETARCGDSATRLSTIPASTIAMPNSRLCGSRRARLGDPAMPIASPTNSATNSRPNADSPPRRLFA